MITKTNAKRTQSAEQELEELACFLDAVKDDLEETKFYLAAIREHAESMLIQLSETTDNIDERIQWVRE
jgi:hypothetical protein